MPPNTVCVSRPSRWGNPFVVETDVTRLAHYADWKKNTDCWTGWPVKDSETAVVAFRHHYTIDRGFCERVRKELKGKNLACWCKPDSPCHADVLLEIANGSP